MDRETAVFIAVLIILILYALTGSELILAVISSLAVLYILPLQHLPKLLGYLVLSDIVYAMWFAGLAASTLGGLQLAALTGLIYAVISRELRSLWGTERISINSQTDLHKQAAELATYAIGWGSALFSGLKSGKVEAPARLNICWVVETEPGGWEATRTYKALSALRESLFGWV